MDLFQHLNLPNGTEKISVENDVSNLKTLTFDEIYHKNVQIFSSKLNSNIFPSNSEGGKPKDVYILFHKHGCFAMFTA